MLSGLDLDVAGVHEALSAHLTTRLNDIQPVIKADIRETRVFA